MTFEAEGDLQEGCGVSHLFMDPFFVDMHRAIHEFSVQHTGPKGRNLIATPVRAWTRFAIKQERRRCDSNSSGQTNAGPSDLGADFVA
jgi:hypothetical protein